MAPMKIIPGLSLAFALSSGWADDVATCRAMVDDANRLACYDTLFAEPDAAFGHEQVQTNTRSDKVDAASQMTSKVAKISKPKGRAATLTLENGQVWAQVSFRYVRLREGDEITIRPSRFGGYILANERGVTMRVRRIR